MEIQDAQRDEIYRLVSGLAVADSLFESLDNAIYCVKNRRRQYVSVNSAFVARVRLPNKAALLGRTAREMFPMPLAAGYEQQDDTVFLNGKEIRARLHSVDDILMVGRLLLLALLPPVAVFIASAYLALRIGNTTTRRGEVK